MKTITLKRRAFITRSASVSLIALAGLPTLKGCSGASGACVDLESLSAGEQRMRTEREYAQTAPNAAKRCEGCQFFHADAAAPGCGRCDILRSVVNATGWCNAWTAGHS